MAIAESLGLEVDQLNAGWGSAVDPEKLADHLTSRRTQYDAVTLTHNETSTGVTNDVAALARVIREESPNTLILVDAVSSLGGIPVRFDEWGLDVCLASVQKGIALPPGITVFAVSPRALARCAKRPYRGTYLDFLSYKKHADDGNVPSTPSIPHFYALAKQLDDIINVETLDARYRRHEAMRETTIRRTAALRGARLRSRARLGDSLRAPSESPARRAARRDEKTRLHPRRRLRQMEGDHLPHRPHGRHPARRPQRDARCARRGRGIMKILVTDTLADSGLAILRAASDMEVDYRPGLKGDALLKAVSESDALITRSGTAVTEELVNAGRRLRIVGRAGVGLDNVDVDACTARGILVINAPTANIMSATEHTMAMLLALCRNIPEAHASVKRGEWNRSKFLGTELDGKTLGIIGLGRIGTRITVRARAFGMRVIAYDPYVAPSVFDKVGAERVSLDDLLARADVITVHTPLTDETRGMIGASEIAKMKDGVVVLNIARGGIYDEQSLADALNSGKIAGAAIDVYVEEPPKDNPLLSAKNIILSPHIGANTIEAQDRVAVQTSEMVIDALRGSIFVSAVNLPFEGLADADAAPFINMAERLGLFAAQIISGPITRAAVELWGIDERLTRILSVAALKGMLTPRLAESVNFVNAEQVAQQRGIAISATTHPMPLDYTNLVTFRASSATDETCVSATLFSEKNQRIVSVNNFRVEFKPEGTLLYIINKDVPGVVGKVGTILGDREINIAEYNLARETSGGKALAIVTIDSPLDADTMAALRFFKAIEEVKQVRL